MKEEHHAMNFQLRYITTDFDFRDQQLRISHPEKGMDFLIRKRTPEDASLPELQADDGFVTVTCKRETSVRLQSDAVSSGQLSIKREAVNLVHREMYEYMLHTMRLIRWRTNSRGRPHPI